MNSYFCIGELHSKSYFFIFKKAFEKTKNFNYDFNTLTVVNNIYNANNSLIILTTVLMYSYCILTVLIFLKSLGNNSMLLNVLIDSN